MEKDQDALIVKTDFPSLGEKFRFDSQIFKSEEKIPYKSIFNIKLIYLRNLHI